MTTARTVIQVITSALGLVGHYQAGESLNGDDTTLALQVLQDLLAEWAGQGITIPSLVTEAVTLVPAQASYTLGENGVPSLSTVAPEQVLGGYVRDSGGTDYPIVGMLSAGQYRNLIDKSYTSGRPDRIWVNYTAPNVTVYTYPIPDTAESLYLQSIKPFTEITATNQNLAVALGIPRSYHSALTFNLAVDLAPHFNRQLDPTIAARAMRSKQTIINLNAARNLRPVALEVPMGEYSYGSFDGDNLI